MGLLKIGAARALSDERLALVTIVVGRLLKQDTFELLLVKLARVLANFYEHLN